MNCVSGERLAAALASRRPELWDSNPRLAERIEMRIKDAQRAHRQAHGREAEARQCLGHQQHDSASGVSMFTVYCQWSVHDNLPPPGRHHWSMFRWMSCQVVVAGGNSFRAW
jgi:hypothetical protein